MTLAWCAPVPKAYNWAPGIPSLVLRQDEHFECILYVCFLWRLGKPSKKKNYGGSEIGPTPLNPPTPTSDREKKCRDSCVEI